MRLLRALAFLTAISLSPWVSAQEGYQNSCDPAKPRDCFLLAKFYSEERGGFPPFPVDVERSAELKKLAFSVAQEGCKEDRARQCLHLILLAPDDDIGLSLDDSASLVETTVQKSEDLCLSGNFEACELFDDVVKADWPPALESRHPDLVDQIKKQARKYSFSAQRLIAAETIQESERQCLSGSRQECANFGKAFFKFFRGSAQAYPSKAVTALKKSCEHHLDDSCGTLMSFLYMRSGVAEDYSDVSDAYRETVSGLQEECTNGRVVACELLIRTTQNHSISLRLQHDACEKGSGIMCRFIALLRYNDFSKSEDLEHLELTMKYADMGCRNNDAYSCHLMEHAPIQR